MIFFSANSLRFLLSSFILSSLIPLSYATKAVAASTTTTVAANDPRGFIYYAGRWDFNSYSSFWPGAGLRLRFTQALSSLTLNLGSSTSSSLAASISIDYGTWQPISLVPGSNVINLGVLNQTNLVHVVRIQTQKSLTLGRMQLSSIAYNSDAQLLPYRGYMAFEFIGDQFSTGNSSSQGANTAWPRLVSETFKAEANIISQNGICFANISCGGNANGMTSQYWKLQDGNGANNPAYNFSSYMKPIPTHIFIALGNNDYPAVSTSAYQTALQNFLSQLRSIYPTQMIYILYDFNDYYRNSVVETCNSRPTECEKTTFFVDTSAWVDFSNTAIVQNGFLTDAGNQLIATQVTNWLLSNYHIAIPDTWPSRTC